MLFLLFKCVLVLLKLESEDRDENVTDSYPCGAPEPSRRTDITTNPSSWTTNQAKQSRFGADDALLRCC
jgi:hypothetical protein